MAAQGHRESEVLGEDIS
uniref:Uncharacterized protein n=1 Tax=Oryza sativa subsp. japonica TaxID=39947 RepID=Q10JY3_ORYSJ|nr:hypothetical protein LOC_Os03g29055 [Oryza sativa Japonica Group]